MSNYMVSFNCLTHWEKRLNLKTANSSIEKMERLEEAFLEGEFPLTALTKIFKSL